MVRGRGGGRPMGGRPRGAGAEGGDSVGAWDACRVGLARVGIVASMRAGGLSAFMIDGVWVWLYDLIPESVWHGLTAESDVTDSRFLGISTL